MGDWAGTRRKKPAASIAFCIRNNCKTGPYFCLPRKQEDVQSTGRSERFFLLSALLLREKGAVADCGVATAARIHHRNLLGRARTLSGDSQSRRGAQSLPLSGSLLF